jgi:hypothetical protein
MGKFVRIRAGFYIAKFNAGFECHIEKVAKKTWTYKFLQNGVVKLTGEAQKTFEAAGRLAYIEADRIEIPVRNLMSGKETLESISTPYYMSVGSESYWSA